MERIEKYNKITTGEGKSPPKKSRAPNKQSLFGT